MLKTLSDYLSHIDQAYLELDHVIHAILLLISAVILLILRRFFRKNGN